MPSFWSWLATLPVGLVLLANGAAAVNLTYYAPESDVEPAFANWIGSFYQAAEASNVSAAGYNDFFSPDSTIELGGWDPSQDVKDGLVTRVHYPTVVAIDGDYPIQRKFHLYGLTKAYYKNSTCEVESYETKFTILKSGGQCDLESKDCSLLDLELVEQISSSALCESF
ncbi:hypothetical protein N7452_010949 [Penicillium brevicompactum]|uniref:Secreted protein n=1 Tax=Penicillium brevicompactum TaxID=5074 RepID=A0A9W9Q198_PENBR|nr:hypothetical protein N7452_010949 [Penicillium brevicompactum]